jgi:hypothetical protein
VVFDRICRHNGIGHLLTKIRYPTTIGKVERWHQSIQTDLLDGPGGFADLAAAQDAVQAWRIEYNTVRPHQSLGMATPAQRFAPIPARQRAALTLWRPPELAAAPPGDDDVTHEPPQTPTAPVLTQPPTRPALDRIVGRASGPTSRPGQSGWPPTG